jgi:hypothetical protein
MMEIERVNSNKGAELEAVNERAKKQESTVGDTNEKVKKLVYENMEKK